jgi:hypothetical protein
LTEAYYLTNVRPSNSSTSPDCPEIRTAFSPIIISRMPRISPTIPKERRPWLCSKSFPVITLSWRRLLLGIRVPIPKMVRQSTNKCATPESWLPSSSRGRVILGIWRWWICAIVSVTSWKPASARAGIISRPRRRVGIPDTRLEERIEYNNQESDPQGIEHNGCPIITFRVQGLG